MVRASLLSAVSLAVGIVSCAESAERVQSPLPPAPPEPAPPEPARRELALGEIHVPLRDEPSPDATFRGQLFTSLQTMRHCWAHGPARLTLDLVIGVQGNTVRALVQGEDDAAARCLTNAFLGWHYIGEGDPLHVTAVAVLDSRAE